MTCDLHQLLAGLSPETYCTPSKRREVRRVLDEGLKQNDPLAVRRAAALAEPRPVNDVALEELAAGNAMACAGLKHPLERHTFSYDCLDDSLEAFYFTLLDHLESRGWEVIKLVDQFRAAAGSGFAGDLSRRAMKSQQEAARVLEASQELADRMLQRVERIKELEKQLAVLNHGSEPGRVDLQASSQRDGPVEDEQDSLSVRTPAPAGEVKTRLELERRQLRNQMDLLRLHARWVQPWLRSGEELHERPSRRADLVTAFNTTMLKVVLLARCDLPLGEMVREGELPKFVAATPHRNYRPCVLIELGFRSAPKRVSTGTHVHRGRIEVVLTGYALHDAEVGALEQELDRDGLDVLLGTVGAGSAAGAESTISDIERLLNPVQPATPAREDEDGNPFFALWSLIVDAGRWLVSLFRPEPVPDDLAPDRSHERVLRSRAILISRKDCLDLFKRLKALDGSRSGKSF